MEEEIQTIEEEVEVNSDYDERDEELIQERLKREKAESRFKKTAKELNELKAKQSNSFDENQVNELVSKRIEEEAFYLHNPIAKEFKSEIQAIKQSTNLSDDDAFSLFMAKNNPEKLVQRATNNGVEGVSKIVEPIKNIQDMTFEELEAYRKGL